MPSVRFYTGLVDRSGFAARLLRKATRQNLRVWVVGDEPALKVLSQRLWSLPGFAPHAGPSDAPSVRRRSPVRFGLGFADADADCSALLNLSGEFPDDLGRWEHVFELVGVDPDAVRQGRAQFKAYRARGCSPEHFESDAA